MERVIRFTVSMAAIFYDALSGKVIPPATLTFHCGERTLTPIIKENSFAVFVYPDGNEPIRVCGAFYREEWIHRSDPPDGSRQMICCSLYPGRAYPYRQGCLTLEGSQAGLRSIHLIGVKKSLWLRIGTDHGNDGTLWAEDLTGRRLPTEIGLYLADRQQFRTVELGRRRADGRCTVGGDATEEELVRGVPVKLYRAEVTPTGAFFLLAEAGGGDYLAALGYAQKTVWKTYVENGDKLVLKGGG